MSSMLILDTCLPVQPIALTMRLEIIKANATPARTN